MIDIQQIKIAHLEGQFFDRGVEIRQATRSEKTILLKKADDFADCSPSAPMAQIRG